jgi:hypothetical protein
MDECNMLSKAKLKAGLEGGDVWVLRRALPK